jgi:predicted Fe-S protein YdhL (DUF1289 family)
MSSNLPDPAGVAAGNPTDETLFDGPDSPCIGICSTLFDEICQGCGRTAGEVSHWVFMSEPEKRAVWERITREGTARRFRQV